MAINPNDITTVRVGELPPAAFGLTDKIPHEVGVDLKYGTVQQLLDLLAPLAGALQYEVKTLHVNSAYIAANFDGTGLGINLMTGYAICNGNNGTLNMDGRVNIGYGSTYNVIGQNGGSKDAVLIAHTHGIDMGTEGFSGGGNQNAASNIGTAPAKIRTTVSAGSGNGIDKNMQPYIVSLKVMKL